MIKEQVNLGRFLSTMDLENAVLSDGVLTSQALEERASLIQGIIKGKLEKGEWQSALWMVYTPGPVKALFDGNWEGFHDGVVASAKDQKQEISKELMELLAKNKRSSGLLCRLIDEIPYHTENLDNLFSAVYGMVDKEALARLRKRIGERAFEAKDYPTAYRRFDPGTAENENLYQTLLANPSENIDLLLAITKNDAEKQKEIVKKVLKMTHEEIHHIDLDCCSTIEEKLYEIVNNHKIDLTKKEWKKLRETAVKDMRHYDMEKTGDKELALLWAKKHYDEEPVDSYKIFIKQEYKGKEVIDAVRTAFGDKFMGERTFSDQDKLIKKFQDEHLRKIYPEQDLYMRIKLAYHLKDKEKMLELSKESFEAKDYESSYNLWIRGEGELDCEHMDKLRPKIKRKNQKSLGGVTEHAYDYKDTVGLTQYFEEIVKKHPFTAYKIAKDLKDEDRIQRAREGFVAKDPEYALERFRQKYHGPDLKGVEMCIEALAKKYEIPAEQIKKYVTVETE